jgi:hypothetical protein
MEIASSLALLAMTGELDVVFHPETIHYRLASVQEVVAGL